MVSAPSPPKIPEVAIAADVVMVSLPDPALTVEAVAPARLEVSAPAPRFTVYPEIAEVMLLKMSLPPWASTVTPTVVGAAVRVSTPAVPMMEVPPAPVVVVKAKVLEEKKVS